MKSGMKPMVAITTSNGTSISQARFARIRLDENFLLVKTHQVIFVELNQFFFCLMISTWRWWDRGGNMIACGRRPSLLITISLLTKLEKRKKKRSECPFWKEDSISQRKKDAGEFFSPPFSFHVGIFSPMFVQTHIFIC